MEKLLLYCTKEKPYLYGCYGESDSNDLTFGGFGYNVSYCPTEDEDSINRTINLNGTIVAECECDLVEEILNEKVYYEDFYGWRHDFSTNTLCGLDIFKKSCLKEEDLLLYLDEEKGYALHLKNPKIFDKPLTFKHNCIYTDVYKFKLVKRAPQNMMYVYNRFGNRYILLPIKPQYLVHILNGEKTIEVRRKILNALKELIR